MTKRLHPTTSAPALSQLSQHLIRTLLYFDIFKYPLKGDELTRYCNGDWETEAEVQSALDHLVSEGLLEHAEGFYFIGEEKGRIERRQKGNALAASRMKTARRVSRFIGKFPFVRAVMLSGSLSKGYMEGDSDIDYFVVTAPGRLWLARTLLIFYKKVVLLNSHRNFCVNYFVDTEHLEIEDKNIFTATETVFLLPTYNYDLYRQFRAANTWAEAHYQNFGLQSEAHVAGLNKAWFRRSLEALWGGKMGTRLDTWCMKRTMKRWDQKFGDFDAESFEIALRSRKYVSKHHPQQFQKRVLDGLQQRIQNFEERHGVTL